MADTERNESVCVLLGSGASISAGMPRVDELTRRIECDAAIFRHTSGNYYLGQAGSSSNQRMQQRLCEARKLFRSVRLHVGNYFEREMGRQPNYEDVYYLIEQMYAELSDDTDNPLVMHWLCSHLDAESLIPLSKERTNNIDIITECRHLIRDVVWQSLINNPTTIAYLDNLLAPLSKLPNLNLFSLNHDLVLDKYLTTRNLAYCNGFGCAENGVRYWNPHVFDRSMHNIHLYKLHGSVDWFFLRPWNSELEAERVGISLSHDFWHTSAPDGRPQYPVNARPVFLAGTFNKISDYADDIFIELHYRFMSCLRKSTFLVVCGYSFGDKGINGRVLSWLLGRTDRKMIVIHKNPSQAQERARGAVRNKWDELRRLGRIQVVESWVEDLDPDALAALIG